MPSYILLRSPGPNSTESGIPRFSTGSPGLTPAVSSYTWTIDLSPSMPITSPIRPSLPILTTSYIRVLTP